MSNRMLGVVTALVVVVGVVAGVVVLASGDGAFAYKVGGHQGSQSSVDDELSVLHDNPALASSIVQQQLANLGDGSVPSQVAAAWLQVRVISDFAGQQLRAKHERVTAADRASVGLPVTRESRRLPKGFRNDLIARIARVRALQRVVAAADPSILDQARASCASGRYVSHILVATQQEASAIRQQLAGGADFAALAKAKSTDASAANGGQLGCLDDLQNLVEPFGTVARSQPLGVVSAPVQTQFGFHLVLVTDQPTQADVQAASLAVVLKMVKRAKVDVDPRYGRWSPGAGRVVPPVVPGARSPSG